MSQHKSPRPAGWLKSFAQRLGLGIAAAGALVPAGPVTGQTIAYRSSEDAPPAWREFALLVKTRLQDWLARDDEAIRRFMASLEARSKGRDAPATIALRIWVTADGQIERAEFDGLDSQSAVELRSLLARKDIGAKPPGDLMQPLHLRVALQNAN